MDSTRLFDELVAVACKLGVEVRLEPLAAATTGGGFCTLGGRSLILIDQRAPVSTRVEVLARAMARLETEAVYMTPAARDALDTVPITVAGAGSSIRRYTPRGDERLTGGSSPGSGWLGPAR
jgi:hypothetical protein